METNKQITVDYNGNTVTYNERENTWEFTLRGVERSAESLDKARDIINKPPPLKKKAVEKIECYYMHYRRVYVATATSIVTHGWRSGRVRISYYIEGHKLERSVVDKSELSAKNEHNDKLMVTVQNCLKQIEALNAEIEKAQDKLKPLDFSQYEQGDEKE